MAQTELLDQNLETWGITQTAVANALAVLRSRPIHPAFSAYLCLKREARREGREDNLQLRYLNFFTTFLKLGDQPESFPYLQPFNESGKPTAANAFFNKNVAGSYAPSSIRPTSPLRKVADIQGQRTNARFRLLAGHEHHAAEHMLSNTKIPPLALASVLYRDFGLIGPQPAPDDLLTIFKNEFGYRESVPSEHTQYSALFDESNDPMKGAFDVEKIS